MASKKEDEKEAKVKLQEAEPEESKIPRQIQVRIFPSIWCPECGVPLEGRSPTGLIKGGRNGDTHPFQGESMQKIKEQGIEVVRMMPCTLRGMNFEAPTVLLTEIPKTK